MTDNIAEIFTLFYREFVNKPDALGIAWEEELENLGKAYATAVSHLEVRVAEAHLRPYRSNPAEAVAFWLPEVSPADIIDRNVRPPIINEKYKLFAINRKPCSIKSATELIYYPVLSPDDPQILEEEVLPGEQVSESAQRALRNKNLEGCLEVAYCKTREKDRPTCYVFKYDAMFLREKPKNERAVSS